MAHPLAHAGAHAGAIACTVACTYAAADACADGIAHAKAHCLAHGAPIASAHTLPYGRANAILPTGQLRAAAVGTGAWQFCVSR